MPTIPRYDNFQVVPTVAPSGPAAAPRSTAGLAGAQQLQDFGQTVSRSAAVASDIFVREQEEANKARVFEAYTKHSETLLELEHGKTGYRSFQSGDAVRGVEGKSLADHYREQADKTRSDLAAELGNDAQRTLFNELTTRDNLAFYGRATKHEVDEGFRYQQEAADSQVAMSVNRYALADDEDERETARAMGEVAISAMADRLGKPPQWIEQQNAKLLGSMVTAGTARLLEAGEVDTALALYSKHVDKLDADSIVRIEGALMGEVRVRAGDEAAAFALEGAPRPPAEGGPPPAKLPTSAEVQSMIEKALPEVTVTSTDRTAAQQAALTKAGYPTAKGTSYHELGQAVDFIVPAGQDPQQAMLRAIAALRSKGVPIAEAMVHGKGSKEHVHIAIGGKRASAPESAAPADTLSDALARVDELTPDPRVRQLARARVKEQWGIKKADEQDKSERALLAFQQAAAPGVSYSSMPVALREGLRLTGQEDAGMRYLEALSGPTSGVKTNVSDLLQFYEDLGSGKLDGMSAQTFNATYASKFSESDMEQGFKALMGAKGDATNRIEGAAIQSLADMTKDAAISAGVLPPLNKQGQRKLTPEQEKSFGEFQKRVADRVFAFEASELGGKRKANRAEVQTVIDGVLLDEVNVREPTLFGSKQVRAKTLDLTPAQLTKAYVKIGGDTVHLRDISPTQRQQITEALIKTGQPVTELGIAQMWVRGGRRK